MSETATNELVNTLNDPEEPFTAEVEEAAAGVTGVLKNVLKSSSTASQSAGSAPDDTSSSKVKEKMSISGHLTNQEEFYKILFVMDIKLPFY